jgi:D-3-phosphoglycerate dehydrogenase
MLRQGSQQYCRRALILWPRAPSPEIKESPMKIAVLDDYQDAVRKLPCFSLLEGHDVKVFNNTVKGVGQLAARLSDVEALVLIRERTRVTRQLLEKLPKLKIISQTGRAGGHVDIEACTDRGVVVLEGVGSPVAPAELTWALIMAAQRRIPQYVASLKHGAWQQSGLKSTTMPPNFGWARCCAARRWASGATARSAACWPAMGARSA